MEDLLGSKTLVNDTKIVGYISNYNIVRPEFSFYGLLNVGASSPPVYLGANVSLILADFISSQHPAYQSAPGQSYHSSYHQAPG